MAHNRAVLLPVLVGEDVEENKESGVVREKTQLQHALNKITNLTSFELAAAKILWKVNGIKNALEYVELLKMRKNDPTQ